jgi:hypothetical protein
MTAQTKIDITFYALLFAITPLLVFFAQNIHFIPALWKLPYYLNMGLGVPLIILAVIILRKSEKPLALHKNPIIQQFGITFLTTAVVAWLAIWVLIPWAFHDFVVENPEKQLTVGNRIFHLYSFGHKRHSKTIIYEQTGTWTMTKIEEIPYSFELVKAVVQDSKVNFMVNDKPVVKTH